jgi:hypothetical protein
MEKFVNYRGFSILMSILLLGFFSACDSRDLKVSEPNPGSFAILEQYTFIPKCVQCHTALGSYDALIGSGVINLSNPSESKLYTEVKDGSMPYESTNLSDAEIQAILTWIEAGAPNN